MRSHVHVCVYIDPGVHQWFFKDTLNGNSSFSLIAFPFVLLYHSVMIYVLPTVGIYLNLI